MKATEMIPKCRLGRYGAGPCCHIDGVDVAEPWTSSRQSWATISRLPGIATPLCTRD